MIKNKIIYIIKGLFPESFRFKLYVRSWRKKNQHNKVYPVNKFNINKVKVGCHSYGPITVKLWGAENEKLIIGDYCSISEGVKFILGGNHYIKELSNFSFKYFFEDATLTLESKGPIIVEDGVWIGTDAIILSGVTLGKGSIVAAGSIVTKDVSPYSIVGGNPAKFIKNRFSDTMIEELINMKHYQAIDKPFYIKNKHLLNCPLNEEILEELKNALRNISKI